MKAKCLMMTDLEDTFYLILIKYFLNAFQKLQYNMSAHSSFYYFSNTIKQLKLELYFQNYIS